eukprot:c54388_g1_i1 orf=2-151(-)
MQSLYVHNFDMVDSRTCTEVLFHVKILSSPIGQIWPGKDFNSILILILIL